MVRAARLTSVDDVLLLWNKPARHPCPFGPAVKSRLDVRSESLPLASWETMVSYKQFGLVRSAFLAHNNVISDVWGRNRGELVMVAAMENGKTGAARRLRSRQKPNFLLRKLVSRFIQPGDLVVDLLAVAILTAVACFTVPRHRLFVGWEVDPEWSCVAKEAVVRHFEGVLWMLGRALSSAGKQIRLPLR